MEEEVGFVICSSCGARIKAGRRRCLRCGELLSTEGRSWQHATNGQMLIAGTVASLVALATGVILWQTSARSVDDVARPATPASARPSSTTPAPGAASVTAQAPAATIGAHVTFREPVRAGDTVGGDFSAARTAYEDALQKNPDDPETLNNLGQVLVRLGKVNEAVPRFERAATLAPAERSYLFNLAHARGELGQWDGAIAAYRDAARLSPTDDNILFNLGLALHMRGDDQAAIVVYQKAIELAPQDPTVHVLLAMSFEKVRRVDDAAAEYQRYLDMEPSAPDASQVQARIRALAPTTNVPKP